LPNQIAIRQNNQRSIRARQESVPVVPENKMKRSPLRRVSKKLAKENVAYRKARAEWISDRIAKDGYLQCQFVGKPWSDNYADDNERCVMAAMTVPHHKMRRGKYLADQRYFFAACAFHHSWLESNKREARNRGYILYK